MDVMFNDMTKYQASSNKLHRYVHAAYIAIYVYIYICYQPSTTYLLMKNDDP